MEKINIGIIGLGSIFSRVMTDIGNFKNCRLYALAARDLSRAEEAAKKYGAKKAFGSYEELLDCPEVDLVYIATPHGLHRDQAIMCMEHGKNVICEKAFALNDTQASEMVSCARDKGVFLMEAMWTRFLPAIYKLREIIASGDIGEVLHVSGDFAFRMPFMPEHRLFDRTLGGGSLLDVGVYSLSMISMILGTDIDTLQSVCNVLDNGVDSRAIAQLRYKSGATAQFMSAFDVNGTSRMTVYGTKALIDIPDFWHATRLEKRSRDGLKTYEFPKENEGHHYQFDHAAECIRKGLKESPIMPLDETVSVMKILTDIRKQSNIKYPCD